MGKESLSPNYFRLRTFADAPGCWVGDLFRSAENDASGRLATLEGAAFIPGGAGGCRCVAEESVRGRLRKLGPKKSSAPEEETGRCAEEGGGYGFL